MNGRKLVFQAGILNWVLIDEGESIFKKKKFEEEGRDFRKQKGKLKKFLNGKRFL